MRGLGWRTPLSPRLSSWAVARPGCAGARGEEPWFAMSGETIRHGWDPFDQVPLRLNTTTVPEPIEHPTDIGLLAEGCAW